MKPPSEQQPLKFYAEYSVNSGLDFGRAAAEASTKVSTTVNTLKSITKQLMPASATEMVLTDIRTPPKIKSQMAHSQMQSLLTPGKGEAIPVVLEGNDDAALEKISSDNFKYVHSDSTPSSGLSTWILLNSDAISTPLSQHKKVSNKPVLYDVSNLTTTENSTDAKKKVKPSPTTTTDKNLKSKIEAMVMKKPERKPIATVQKVNQTHTKKPTTLKLDPEDSPLTTTGLPPQDSKFKNKTPVVVGKVPNTTKVEANATTPIPFIEPVPDNGTRLGTPVVTFPHVPVRQRPNSAPQSTTRKPVSLSTRPSLQMISNGVPTRVSSSVQDVPIISTLAATSENTVTAVTEEITPQKVIEITTKRTVSTSGKKKKKKNKNKKRRRPVKKPAKIQSKISEDDNSTSKLPGALPSRPLSTRIYNYLAREVMPNVGVGLVGLMLTAGLAGLLLYPFGGAVPIRRNYEKPHPAYNLNDYPPVGEVDNAQPEESVLSQVLAGMSNSMNQYSREQPDMLYKTPPKYKPGKFDNPSTFTYHKDSKYTTERGINDPVKYSELGDVVSGPHESVKFTSFDINDSIKHPMDTSQPSPSYSTIDLTTSSQNEPIGYHKHTSANESPDSIKHENVYSTLGEYASYSSLSEPVQNPVYHGESYDYKNHKTDDDTQEFKVSSEMEVITQAPENQTAPTTSKNPKHEQPSFAALEGIPKHYRTLQTSIRFEDTAASVLPMAQDFVPSDGVFATSVEHGPRNIKLQRRKRNTSENELDSVLIDGTEKGSDAKATTHSPVQFITTNETERPPTTVTMETSTTEADNNTLYSTNESVASISEIMSNEILPSEDAKIVTSSTEASSQEGWSPVIVVPHKPATLEGNYTYSGPKNPKDETEVKNETANQSGCENCDLSNIEERPPSPPAISLGTMFRKILDFKLRIGLELIRATSEAISNYLGSVQQRMSEALRNLQRSTFRTNNYDTKSKSVIKKRDKRHIIFGSLV